MRMAQKARLAAASAAIILAAAPFAARAEVAGGVIGCDASGNKQIGGAVLGAVIGGVAGSNLAKNDRTTGTVVGATAGAAAGSYVGCRMQKSDANKAAAPAPAAAPVADRYYDRDAAHARPAAYADDRYHEDRPAPPGLAKKPHHMPPGLAKKYYGVGERLPTAYVGEPRNSLSDPRRYGLRYAPSGYRWVVIERDAYLVRTRTGVITDVARAIFG
ncbi:RcnB family protein [Phenylobacterium sp. LjRoot219]|uniref:RcnB family protein n=1 Tax=Phenylobacterium sp. LjRoot219 TaxID=3342283 RepID=UPI003ECD72F6